MKNGTTILILLIAVGLFFTFTNPQYQDVKILLEKSGEYANVLQNVAGIANMREDLSVKYQSLPQDELQRLSKILPDHIDNVRLALDLDTVASQYGISIKNIRIDDQDQKGATIQIQNGQPQPYQRVTVSFGFTATYPNFKKFLSDVEKNLRITDVRALSFQSTETGLYDFSMTVETYWLGDTSGNDTISPVNPNGQGGSGITI